MKPRRGIPQLFNGQIRSRYNDCIEPKQKARHGRDQGNKENVVPHSVRDYPIKVLKQIGIHAP
jgi:hypothetical protein